MKKEITNRLTCENARMFPIVEALAKLGHFPTRTTEKEAWFLSPFRSETQASLKVSKGLNRWYDHGAGRGGNVIDLVCDIKGCSVREALQTLSEDQLSFSFHQQPISLEIAKSNRINITQIKQLTHVALKNYLNSRYIPISTAKPFVREVHYEFRDKAYFAIGLKNDSGGWELRNKYFKNSSSPKDITHIKNGNERLVITEGMFDLLSVLETRRTAKQEFDYLILNSTAFVQKAEEVIKAYKQIELYLDNDASGRRTTKGLMDQSKNCVDRSQSYKDFKDMNAWLMQRRKDSIEHGIQDVSLLPQRPTCFTPDGRKEGKE